MRTVALINRFGLDRDTLTSVNALMPIIYYLSRLGRDLNGSTEFEAKNAERIRIWLTAALLRNAFGGSVNTTLTAARKYVKEGLEESDNFPTLNLAAGLKTRGRTIELDDVAADEIFEIRYGHKTCFLALSLLYDQTFLGIGEFQIDHIFPRSLFDSPKLRERGLTEAFAEKCRPLVDRLGNLQLLLSRENAEKTATPFDQWIDTRSDEFVETHLIPRDSSLWCIESFHSFVEQREKLIKKRLGSLLRLAPYISGTMAAR